LLSIELSIERSVLFEGNAIPIDIVAWKTDMDAQMERFEIIAWKTNMDGRMESFEQ
jgi:hypothetical protein